MSDHITRRSDFVLPLEKPFQVRAEDAFIDRMEMSIGAWGLYGSKTDVRSQLQALRQAEVFDRNGEVIPLFNSFNLAGLAGSFDIRFATARTDDKNIGQSPLIAGKMEKPSRYTKFDKLDGTSFQLSFACTLNLTRWVQAQELKRITHLKRPRLASGYVMAMAPDEKWYADERPLVPSTNVIIGSPKRYGYAKRHPLEIHFANYLRATSRMLNRALASSPSDGQRMPTRQRYYALREIEFYWEFDHDSPISYVWKVVRPALTLSARGFHGIREYGDPFSEVVGQSPNVRVLLAKGVWLRIYAKTDRRVRYEILLESAAVSKILRRRTAGSFQSIARSLGSLRTAATAYLNDVLPVINQGPPASSSHTALVLLSEIQRACADHHLAETIAGALVAFGRVTPFNNDPLRSAVDKLKKAGILEPIVPRSRHCVVTSHYREPLERLRQSLSAAPLATHPEATGFHGDGEG